MARGLDADDAEEFQEVFEHHRVIEAWKRSEDCECSVCHVHDGRDLVAGLHAVEDAVFAFGFCFSGDVVAVWCGSRDEPFGAVLFGNADEGEGDEGGK